jgi:hypothetical protein
VRESRLKPTSTTGDEITLDQVGRITTQFRFEKSQPA